MAIRRILPTPPGVEPALERAAVQEEPKLSYAEARAAAQALVAQLSQESDSLKAWAVLFNRYKAGESRIEIRDLTQFVLNQNDDPQFVHQVLMDMHMTGHTQSFMAVLEKIGNRRLLAELGEYRRDVYLWQLYVVFSTARAQKGSDAIVEAAKGTSMDVAIMCLKWMIANFDDCDEVTRVTILKYADSFHFYSRQPAELKGQLNVTLDALIRKGLSDPNALVVWRTVELARTLNWPIHITNQAVRVAYKPALNAGSPEFGLPFYLGMRTDVLRSVAWNQLTDSWQREEMPDLLALGDIRPIHSLADFNPDIAERAPILEKKLKRLERMIKKYGTGRDVLERYLFGEGSTHQGRTILVSELTGPGESKQWFAIQGHHRLAAMYVAAQRGLVPEAWLSHIPVKIIPDTGKFPSRVVRHVMTDNYNFGWQDLLPPDFASGRRGAKPRLVSSKASGSGRGLRPAGQMHGASALWRPVPAGGHTLTGLMNRH